MSLRRAGTLVLALALSACQSVTQEAQSTDLVFASYNSATGAIPLPNDLLLQIYTAPTAAPSATVPQAQIEVLRGYARSGGFPSDVEAAITIPFNSLHWNGSAYVAGPAPTLDPASVRPDTVVLLRWDTAGGTTTAAEPEVVAYDPVITAGRLTLRPPQASATSKVRHWKGGRYVVAVRGGPRGVKTDTGASVNADSGVALAIQNKDMSIKENQPPGFTAAQAAQVNGLRAVLWNAFEWSADDSGAWTFASSTAVAPAFTAVNAKFPYAETATISTFSIDNSAHVALDSSAGLAPFPSDFLLETKEASAEYPQGCQVTLGAPRPCIKFLPDTFGPAATGLHFLDGFSTTALVTAPLTGPVDATTVTWNNVHLFEILSAPPFFSRVKDVSAGAGANYATQPPGTSAGGFTTTLVLAPAITFGPLYLPPLKERTRYVVVVTNRVKNADGKALTRGAAANVILSTKAATQSPAAAGTPLYLSTPNGNVALVSGLDGDSAKGLQDLRDGLSPLLANLPAFTTGATTKDDVVMAYTFTTQSIATGPRGTAAVLPLAAGAVPTAAAFLSPAQVGAEYGVDATTAFPGGVVSEFAEVTFNTQNLLLSGNTGGSFDPTHPTAEPVVALVAIPEASRVTGACPAAFPAGAKCAPLVVFRHGLPRAKGDMLPIATRLAAEGYVVAAIDAEKFGDRTYCGGATQAAANQQCLNLAGAPASTCVDDPKLHGPGDPAVVGRCSNGLLRARVDCPSLFDGTGALIPACLSPKGIPAATGQFVISTNFFRSRDTFRQDVIDQAALVNALAPAAPPAAGADPFYDHLAAANLAVNPDEVYFASLSFGSTNAALSVALNPRFKKGAFQSGFATITDAFFNPESKYYATAVDLLAGLGVTPGTPAFTQYQQVLKWILDPADPANYGAIIQASGKPVLSQIGLCDSTVPNAQSMYFTAMLGLPVPAAGAATPTTGYTQWFSSSATSVTCPDAQVDHGWLIDPTAGTLMTQAQDAYASFLSTGVAQPTTVRP